MSGLTIDRVWIVECYRCAHESISDQYRLEDAEADFLAQGWTVERHDQFCPRCSGGAQ